MTTRRCKCGHQNPTHKKAGNKVPLSAAELTEPHRLVALLDRRPELSGVGLVRLAEATLECA